MELDLVQREHREIREKIKNAKQIKDSKSINEFNNTEKEFKKIKEELDEMIKEHSKIKNEIIKGQTTVHNIRKQQIEVGKELDKANSKLYNAKQELQKKYNVQNTNAQTQKEKNTIKEKTNEKANAGVIEAASIVVGSLKSKLSNTQKELEQIQGLLEEERESHKKTRQELIKIKSEQK